MASTGSRTPRKKRPVKRKTKRSTWEAKFMPLLVKHHAHYAKTIFHRLMNKSSSLRSGLKRRSKDYEVECNITLMEVRNMLFVAYGKSCHYCKKKLDITNMVCDHKTPISSGGDSTCANLQMICATCNTRKGPLTDKEFTRLLQWIRRQPQDVAAYILRKLAAREVFR